MGTKKNEAPRDLAIIKKDLVYVPEFDKPKALQELVEDIHGQFEEGGDGWDGDALSFSSNPQLLELSNYPYILVVGGDFAESIFAFQSKTDRDCIVSDYLRDPGMWG